MSSMDLQIQLLPDDDQEHNDDLSQHLDLKSLDQLPCLHSAASINSDVIDKQQDQQGPNLKSLQLCDEEPMVHGQQLLKAGFDTHNSDKNEDIYINKDGEILRGEKAKIAKAFHDIEERRCSRKFTITLKSCGSNESLPHCDHSNPDDDTHQETDGNTGNENANQSGPSSLTDQSYDEEQNMNSLYMGEHNSSPTEDLHTDKSQLQNNPESDIHDSINGTYSQSCEEFADEDDLATIDEICRLTQVDSDSDSLYYDSDNESIDCHVELVQDTTEIVYIASDTEEIVDFHRSVEQQLVPNTKVKKTINEHTRSKVSSSKEVLKRTSTKAACEVRVASTDGKLVSEKLQCVTLDNKVTGRDVRMALADAKLVDTKLQTGTVVNKIEGAEMKVASADVTALNVRAGASLNATTKGVTTTAASIDLTGAKVDAQTTAEPTAQGVSSKLGTATIIGAQEKAKASVKATSSGVKVQAGVANITGVKSGVTAEASAEATGIDVNVGTCQITGGEVSATASASASVGTELNIANARVSGFDGVGARASVKAKSGLELFSANLGISGNVGVNVSTTPKVCCVALAPGVPKVGVGPGFLSFGFGGGIEGESGGYAGVAAVGDSKGSSKQGNEYGGSGGDSEGHGSDTGGNLPGNASGTSLGQGKGIASETSAFSPVQGTVEGLSGSLHLNGSISGDINLSNVTSVNVHSSTVGENSKLNVDCHTESQSCVQHSETNVSMGNGNVVGVDLSQQPFHLQALHTLEQQHLSKGAESEKQKRMQPPNKQASGHIKMSGQQTPEYDSPLLDAEAMKLQAKINEHYPLLPGESKSDSVSSKTSQQSSSKSDIERVKTLAISRVSNQGTQGSGSTTSTNSTTDNRTAKRAKPFGDQKNIHTLDCFLGESSKDVVQINCKSSGKFIAGFRDREY